MTATTVAAYTRYARSKLVRHEASDFDHSAEIGDLSRTVEHDIQILKANLAKHHCGHERHETWENAWEHLESAWETVKSELDTEEGSSTLPPEAVSPASVPSAAIPHELAASPPGRFVARVLGVVKSATHPFASATVSHARRGQHWLVANARPRLERACKIATSELGNFVCISRKFAVASAARVRSALPPRQANGRKPIRLLTWTGTTPRPVGPRVQISDRSRSVERDTDRPLPNPAGTLALRASEPSATVPTGPFLLKPLPWLAGALAPVISSRAIQVHHGCHYATCIALANQLSRGHTELAGKSALDIVCWARKNARDTELFVAAAEAWNHAFFWQSLIPSKKRPGVELCRAIDKAFGDFASFAHELAVAGTAHVGSGWLWLVANRRQQVNIVTTPGADSPEYRGDTCLLAIDLWEHAYYFDFQNRRREYLDAVIDRRLNWDFAEARYRLALERRTNARRGSELKPARNRGRHRKRQGEPPASQQ